jgi:hypothetical protein
MLNDYLKIDIYDQEKLINFAKFLATHDYFCYLVNKDALLEK